VREHLRIGELAAELDLNPKTIRYYEEIGLLPEPQRTLAGYRLYGAADRERLLFILKARAVGLSLDEIGEILAVRRTGQPPCEHVLDLLDRKIAGIDQQLRALADIRQELLRLRQDADTRLCADGSICGIIEHHIPCRPPQARRQRRVRAGLDGHTADAG
jgi:DNA-binding transcriptional MerR regulator